jgi:uncharacterized protein (TIGR00369 family)
MTVVFDKVREVRWASMGDAVGRLGHLSGREIMEGIRDGAVAPSPLARLIGFQVVEVKEGEVTLELEPREDLENLSGALHGGVAAALLDTALGAALQTLLPVGQGFATLNLNVSYLRALSQRSGLIRTEARVQHRGRTSAYVLGAIRDSRKILCAHAVGNFALLNVNRDVNSSNERT